MTDHAVETTPDLEQATGLRIVLLENVTHRDRRSIGETFAGEGEPLTLVEVARMLDRAAEDSIDRHGASGIGACAFLEAVFDGDDPDDDDCDGERVESVRDAVFAGLPPGSLLECRSFISAQNRSSCWDGHNHVTAPSHHSQALLDQARGR